MTYWEPCGVFESEKTVGIRVYRIFAGLWFGYEKPVFKIFMKPFAESLKDLFHVGKLTTI